MHTHRTLRAAILPVVVGLMLTACSSDSADTTVAAAETTAAVAETEAAAVTDAAAPTEAAAVETAATADTAAVESSAAAAAAGMAGSLKGVCPDTIAIQTDWYPSAERGPLFNLLGDTFTVDTKTKTITGPLIASDGSDTGVMLQIRSGGPAIGFSPVTAQMYVDKSITLGFTSHDSAANDYAKLPTLSVVAPFEKNPQIVMWDPQTYPDVKTIADLGAKGVKINVFPGGPWQDILSKQGVVPKELWDGSFDGTPARFVSEKGKIAQQGFASAEPYEYEKLPEWGKKVASQLVFDAGVRFYSQPLGIRSADLETLRPCLQKFVPIIQQSTKDYLNNPAAANKKIVDMLAELNEVVYSAGEAEFAVVTMKELGLISNGPDATLGNFDLARVQEGIDQMRDAGIAAVPKDLKADQLATNEFIDPSIGL